MGVIALPAAELRTAAAPFAVEGPNEALCTELLALFEVPAYLPPPLPDVATEILTMSVQPDVAPRDVVRVLERDQMLAGKVLRLVQSPIYAARRQVTTLDEAVLRLGVRLIRDIVFEVAIRQGVFDLPEYAQIVAQLNRHDTVVAYLARLVCRYARVDAPEVFLAGLLHDVGFAGLLFGVAARGRDRDRLPQIWASVDAAHERASERLCEIWRLPPALRAAARWHHEPSGAPQEQRRMCLAVRLADLLSAEYGADVLGPTTPDGTLLTGDLSGERDKVTLARELGISDAELDRLNAEADELVPTILWL